MWQLSVARALFLSATIFSLSYTGNRFTGLGGWCSGSWTICPAAGTDLKSGVFSCGGRFIVGYGLYNNCVYIWCWRQQRVDLLGDMFSFIFISTRARQTQKTASTACRNGVHYLAHVENRLSCERISVRHDTVWRMYSVFQDTIFKSITCNTSKDTYIL